jgi:phosphate transport system protein
MGPVTPQAVEDAILRMGELCGRAVDEAVAALQQRRTDLAQAVVDRDRDLDALELEVERYCLRLLGERGLPPAEVRAVGTAFKMSTDLERMGDHACAIAKAALRTADQPLIKPLIDIPRMAHLARGMLADCLRAYARRDAEAARAAARRDDDVDGLYGQVFRELLAYMGEDPSAIGQGTHLLFVASHLERFADHATNLGEWVVYLVSGRREELNA